jgi:NAD dependent epimerase/dehydratase family enzyme
MATKLKIEKSGDEIKKKIFSSRYETTEPISTKVKLSSAVGAILIEGPNRRTHF